ncbi:PLDc N-terminal domain-containing protein [Actinoplanes philippinensis]|uniref:PLDc N-terminal domain-containing protein n=1 Tax=Actinoplanes philippinensis TaxID=35752 RepID=UPI0033E264E5
MSDLVTTLTGIAFWATLMAAYVTLFGATIVSIARASLDRRSRTRWIWLVVLAPGIGIVLWFVTGRPAARTASSRR